MLMQCCIVSLIACVCASSDVQLFPRLMAQNETECPRWQYKDTNGYCVDRPNVFRPAIDYIPQAGEQCWAECLCKAGTYPSGNGCSPCSHVGTVCIRG
jgi:hypothetical protein